MLVCGELGHPFAPPLTIAYKQSNRSSIKVRYEAWKKGNLGASSVKESHKLIDLKHLNTYTYLKGAFVECCFRHCWHVYGSQLLIHIFFIWEWRPRP